MNRTNRMMMGTRLRSKDAKKGYISDVDIGVIRTHERDHHDRWQNEGEEEEVWRKMMERSNCGLDNGKRGDD